MSTSLPHSQMPQSRKMPSFLRQFLSLLFFIIFFSLSLAILFVQSAIPSSQPTSTIILVWNGMRPDMESSTFTPHLNALGAEGVVALDHHTVAPATELVNIASLATGVFPGTGKTAATASTGTGITDEQPVLSPLAATMHQPVQLNDPQVQIDLQQTLPEGLLQAHTLQYYAARAGINVSAEGTGGTASLQQLDAQLTNTPQSVIGIDDSMVQPTTIIPDLQKYGYVKDSTIPAQWTDQQLAQIFTQVILPRFNASSAPFLSVIDFHAIMSAATSYGMGSMQMMQALQQTDNELGEILSALQHYSLSSSVNIIVTSDHGMENITSEPEPYQSLIDRLQSEVSKGTSGKLPDLKASEIRDGTAVSPTSINAIETGSAIAFFMPQATSQKEDPYIKYALQIQEIARWLQDQPDIGVIVVNDRLGTIPGTIPMSSIHLIGARSPALLATLAAQPSAIGMQNININGFQGTAYTFGSGQATTGSLSSRDLHLIFFADGPSFKQSYQDVLPTGIIDITPTVERILDISVPSSQDGRVLDEMLANDTAVQPKESTNVVASTVAQTASGRKYISVVFEEFVGKTMYIDGGAGASGPSTVSDNDLLQMANIVASQE